MRPELPGRRTQAGSIQSAVRQVYAAGGGYEAVATDLGLTTSLLSRAIDASDEYRPGGLGVNYLDRLARIVPATAMPIAEHFARLAGGRYRIDMDLTPSGCIHTLLSEFSDVMASHAEALSDASPEPERFTPAEARATLEEVKDLRARLDAYEKFLGDQLL